MTSYQRINNLAGWAIFAVALVVYLLTVAPTASFWDCGEFIACANELEVTHPPGAPLFLLMGRIMAMLAIGSENVAWMVNLLSVLAGAFTTLFTFWSTTMLASKGLANFDWDEASKTWTAMGAGAVAGLVCTFADSVWFNAVEAEVYAMSGFFTAIVFWLMLKWEARADQPDHLKWILLIAYLMGLSTGVHLLNLLTVPALALMYFFRKYPFSIKGLLSTLGISVAILAAIQYGILQYSISLARSAELIFTGTQTREGVVTGGLGLPQGTGSLVLIFLVVLSLVLLIIYSQRRQKVVLNTVLLALTLVLIGASSYTTIYIRSNADPAIDMNNPENVFTFLSYMRREQYGDRPLVYGPMYNAALVREDDGSPVRESKGMKFMVMDNSGRYVEDVEEFDYQYDEEVLFPRMYEPSRYNSGPYGYINYVSKKGEDPRNPADDKPTRLEDLIFFLDYQIGHMYLRYFMWNFAGRESDLQDDRWESGLEMNREANATAAEGENKGKNHYFFLPLFLGVLGLVWQSNVKKQDAAILALLFFFTGIAIVLYLNQYPGQPRERDYSYAGSFQVFSIWVGLGVVFLADVLRKWVGRLSHWVALGLALAAPVLMAAQNWDDHTRAGRWIDIEFAKNLLDSCAPNAILFTGGDNDTFPLWYVQEVEGYRTDVRVVNLELLISDWYIDQMKEPKNQSEALPITMERKDYLGDQSMVIYGFGDQQITLPVDLESCVANGVLSLEEAALADEKMVWDFQGRPGGYILRKDSVIINILRNVARDGWKRPVYFGNTMPQDNYASLTPYFRNEGLAYRVIPLKKSEQTINDEFYGTLRPDIMEQRLMEQFKFTGLNDPGVYFDEHIRDVIIANYRNGFYRLAATYAGEFAWRDSMVQFLQTGIDSAAAPSDSLQIRIQALDSEMEELRESVVRALEASEERIPTAVIPQNNLYLLLRQATVLATVRAEEPLATAYATLETRGLSQLAALAANGAEVNPRSLPFQAMLYVMQFHLDRGDEAAFQRVATQVDSLMGFAVSEEFRKQAQPGQ